MSEGPVVVLAGGTGGAKLARGLLDVAGAGLTVVANTGDDLEIYGAHVSPDPDLIAFWLADRIDARGWGLDGDTFAVMDGLRALGDDVWFNLGDRDLAVGVRRARRLAEGASLTEALAELTASLGLTARVLPMTDSPVRTTIRRADAVIDLQEWLIRERGAGPIERVRFDGAREARPTEAVLDALAGAAAIVIGPSNPVISIGPILALPGMREALRAATAPVVAVSPLVRGQVLKGPTATCLAYAGHSLDSGGIAAAYAGLLDGLVADEQAADVPTLVTDVELSTPDQRRRVAGEVLCFAASLA